MFRNTSMTISGVAIVLLSFVLEPSDAETVVNNIVAAAELILPVVGIALTYWGRYRQGDITWYGAKKW